MRKGKNSPERLWQELLKLDPVEFLGICKIIGVSIYKEEENEGENVECAPADREPRNFYDIWNEVCEVIDGMNRQRRRTLGGLIYAATKKEKE